MAAIANLRTTAFYVFARNRRFYKIQQVRLDMLEYFLIFALIGLAGFGLPLPEETVLLIGAYFLAIDAVTPGLAVLTAVLGTLFSDTISYARGQFKWRVFKKFSAGRQFISHAGFFAMFFARFVISARTVLPYMAGAMRMSRLRFYLASFLGALGLSFVYLLGGRWVYWLFERLFHESAITLWFAAVAVITGYLVMRATRAHVSLLRG
jgi:membrane protein DedA with SNARE-associated domain